MGTPPEIAALARSLGADRINSGNAPISATQYSQNVFEYVRNNIEVEFRFGLSKGARGALLDQHGSPFDIAELMVRLLREGGVTANFQRGTITVTAQQFGHWSGVVRDLPQGSTTTDPYVSPQSFQVDARAACQFLADGGIPATFSGGSSCGALSGNLGSSITMAHIWVVANGQSYDPSYKLHVLRPTRSDLVSMLNCSGNCSSATDPIMVGAQTGTVAGAPSLTLNYPFDINNPSLSPYLQINTTVHAYAANLQHGIEGISPSLSTVEVIGGRELFAFTGTAGGTAPTYSGDGTWTEIPDGYRTTVTVKPPRLNGTGAAPNPIGATYFADELAGRRLTYLMPGVARIDDTTEPILVAGGGSPLAFPPCAAPCTPAPDGFFVVDVGRPYPANSYAYGDESVEFSFYEPRKVHVEYFEHLPYPAQRVETSDHGSYPVTILIGLGDAAPSAQQNAAAAQEAVTQPPLPQPPCVPSTRHQVYERRCVLRNEPTLAQSLRVNETLYGAIVSGVTGTRRTRHSQIAMMHTSRAIGASLARDVDGGYFSVHTTDSIVALRTAEDSDSRRRAIEILAVAQPKLEQATFQNPSTPSGWTSGGYPLNRQVTVVNAPPGLVDDVLATLPPVTDFWSGAFETEEEAHEARRRTELQAAANAGHSAIFTVAGYAGGGSEVFVRDDTGSGVTRRGHMLWETFKGAAVPVDPLAAPLANAEISEEAAPRRRYSNVSLADGGLSINAAPDIVTGVGEFPYSLSFARSYRGGGRERGDVQTTNWIDPEGGQYPYRVSERASWIYTGPDQSSFLRLGGGWTHNFDVTASLSGDASRALGVEYAVEASSAITQTIILNQLASPTTLSLESRARMASLYVVSGYANLISIRRGGSTEGFFRLLDRWWTPGSSARVTTADVSYQEWDGRNWSGQTITYVGHEGDQIFFDLPLRRTRACLFAGPMTSANSYMNVEPTYRAAYWTFPSGVRVDFEYDLLDAWGTFPAQIVDGCQDSKAYVLRRVRNNLGRVLEFNRTSYNFPYATHIVTQTGVPSGVTPPLNYANLPVAYRLNSVVDENGRSVQLTRSCGALICNTLSVQDPVGNVTRYEYAPDANSPDPSKIVRSSYHLRRIFTPEQVNGGVTTPIETIRYDNMFRVDRVTSALGDVTRYYPGGIAGGEVWRSSSVISPVSTSVVPVVSTTVFDDRSNAVRSIDPLGNLTRNSYDGFNNLTRTIFPEGNEIRRAYDVRSNVTEVRRISKTPGTPADIITLTGYEEGPSVHVCVDLELCNRPSWERDGRGFYTDYAWDSATGLLLQVRSGLSYSSGFVCALRDPYQSGYPLSGAMDCPQSDFTYSTFGTNGTVRLLTQRVDRISGSQSQSLTSSYSYNASNRYVLQNAVQDVGGLNITTALTFDAVGNVMQVDGPRTDVADVINVTWDPARRLLMRIDADPDGAGALPRPAMRLNYNRDSLLTSSERGTTTASTGAPFTLAATTTYNLDALGRRVGVRASSGGVTSAVTQMRYDAEDRVVCSAVRMNTAVFGSLPTDACALSIQSYEGPDRITRSSYDRAGRLTSVVRGFGTSEAQTYATYGYTLNSQRAWVEDANGNRSGYTYDEFDRVQRLYFPSPTLGSHTVSATDYEAYTYDQNDNRTSVRLRSASANASHVINYGYDALNREYLKDIPGTTTEDVVSAYDLLGRRIYARFGTGGSATTTCSTNGVEFCYDRAGRLLTENSYGRALTYQYDLAGNRTRLTFPDNNYVQYTYDAMNRMDQVRLNGATSGSGLLADYYHSGNLQYAYRGHGNTTAWSADFDAQLRLTTFAQDFPTAGTAADMWLSFAYNPASQVTWRTISNDIYRYYVPGAEPAHVDYTTNGLNQYTAVGSATHSYSGDDGLRGNLTSDGTRSYDYDLENRLISVSTLPAAFSLAYDPLGRLRATTQGATTTGFLYDGDRLVAEYNSVLNGTMLRRYVHGEGVDTPIVWFEGANLATPRWLHVDHQGSINAVSDASGVLVGSAYSYSAFGIPDLSNQWTGSRFRYTGQIMLPEVQLYHYKARVYSPTLGRFLQGDPIGYRDNLNLFTYVNNDPIGNSDPSGLAGCASSLSRSRCQQVLGDQTRALGVVARARAQLRQLRNERREISAGNRQELSAGARATEAALGTAFGSATSEVADAVDENLGKVEDFLRDPGSENGGRYDFRDFTAEERAEYPTDMGIYNPAIPNTVGLNYPSYTSRIERESTVVHEPLHLFGMYAPSVDGELTERYRSDAIALGRMAGGTAAAVYNNPDNYACFLYPGGCR